MSAACTFFGRIPYREALVLQEEVARDVARGARPDTLLLLEHPPTVTLGRRASAADLLADEQELARRGIGVHRIGRGGGATLHGPGQLVGYPIVRLAAGGRRVRHFVARVETLLVRALASLGVRAAVRPGSPGVWVNEAKVGAIGIEIRRRITRHGFALNVDMDLEPWSAIVPCHAPGLLVGDLRTVTGRAIPLEEAVAAVTEAWAAVFGDTEERLAG